MNLETLNEEDLDFLTRVENRLVRSRKREAANRDLLSKDLTDCIQRVHYVRQMLQTRFGKTVDDDL